MVIHEINRRFFAMRMIGKGMKGAMQFCALMDLPSPPVQATYDLFVESIRAAAQEVCEMFMKQAAREEHEKTKKFHVWKKQMESWSQVTERGGNEDSIIFSSNIYNWKFNCQGT